MATSKHMQGLFDMFFNRFWPWFVQQVWPHIEKKVVAGMIEMVDRLIQMVADRRSRRDAQRQQEAEQNAAAAEARARSAKTNDEADAARREAQIWKGVAAMFKKEATELRKDVEAARKQAKREAAGVIRSAKPTYSKQGGGAVMINGEATPLPLPSGSDEEKSL